MQMSTAFNQIEYYFQPQVRKNRIANGKVISVKTFWCFTLAECDVKSRSKKLFPFGPQINYVNSTLYSIYSSQDAQKHILMCLKSKQLLFRSAAKDVNKTISLLNSYTKGQDFLLLC